MALQKSLTSSGENHRLFKRHSICNHFSRVYFKVILKFIWTYKCTLNKPMSNLHIGKCKQILRNYPVILWHFAKIMSFIKWCCFVCNKTHVHIFEELSGRCYIRKIEYGKNWRDGFLLQISFNHLFFLSFCFLFFFFLSYSFISPPPPLFFLLL